MKFICPKLQEAQTHRGYNLSLIFDIAAGNRSKNREMFEKTHTAISLYDKDGRIINEESIFHEFSMRHKGNKCVVIEGETGTGKSEACVKLVYMLQDAGWEVVHIHKNMDLLSMIEELVAFYKKLGNTEYEAGFNIQRMRNELRNPSKRNVIAMKVVADFFLEYILINGNEIESNTMDTLLNKFQRSFAKKMTNLLREQKLEDYQADFFKKSDISRESWLQEIIDIVEKRIGDKLSSPTEKTSEILEEINSKLWMFLNSYFNAPTIDTIMDKINEVLIEKNKRAAMVIEDLKIAAFDREKLLRYIERDRTDDRWDFIIAGTSDVIKEVRKEGTRVERFSFYRTNKETSSKINVIFLNEENAHEFALKYFSFLHEKFDYICKNCNKCKEKNRVLFPFNIEALTKLFQRLDEQKPRTYIQRIYDAIKHYLIFHEPPTNEPNIKRMRVPLFKSKNTIIDDNLRRFLSFYCKEQNKYYTVDTDFLKLVDVQVEEIKGGIIQRDMLHIPTYLTNEGEERKYESISEVTNIAQQTQERATTKTYDPILELEQKYEMELEFVSPWANASKDEIDSKYRETNYYFNLGMKEIMKMFSNDFSLYSGSNVKYFYGRNEFPVIHHNFPVNEKIVQLPIDPTSLPERLCRNVVLLGCILSDKENRHITKDIKLKLRLIKDGIPIFLNIVSFWRQDLQKHIFNQLSSLYENNISEAVNITKRVLQGIISLILKLAYPFKQLDKDEIGEIIFDYNKNDLLSQLEGNLAMFNLPLEIKNEVLQYVPHIIELYKDLIFQNSPFLPYEDLQVISKLSNIDQIIGKITKNRISQHLDKKITFNSIDLSSILMPFKELDLQIKTTRRTDKIDKEKISSLQECLNTNTILVVKKILLTNKQLIDRLDYSVQANLKELSNFITAEEYKQVPQILEGITKNLRRYDHIALPYEEYFFYKWLIAQPVSRAITELTNSKVSKEGFTNIKIQKEIKKLAMEILNVYRGSTK